MRYTSLAVPIAARPGPNGPHGEVAGTWRDGSRVLTRKGPKYPHVLWKEAWDMGFNPPSRTRPL